MTAVAVEIPRPRTGVAAARLSAATVPLSVGVLGDVSLRRAGREVPVRGAKQQALLAMLSLAEGATVPSATLMDALWDELPANAMRALRAQVSRLRATIDWPIEWRHGGYRLAPAPDVLDARDFAERCAVGRAQLANGEYAAAEVTLTGALQLWRGEACAGVPDYPGLRPDRVRLMTLRARAVGDRIDATIGSGRFNCAEEEARALVAADPLVERHWAQLITALERSGRRTEALAEYERLRTELREALGIQPSASLRELHLQLLRAESDDTARRDGADSATCLALPPRTNFPEAPGGLNRPAALESAIATGYAELRDGAPEAALNHFRAARQLLPVDAAWTARADLEIAIGRAQLRVGDPESRRTLLHLAREAHERGDSKRTITAVLANTRGWYAHALHVDRERVALIEASLASVANDAQRAALLAAWAKENVRDPELRDSVLNASARAVKLAESCGDNGVLGRARAARILVLYTTFHDPADCLTEARALFDFAHAGTDQRLQLESAIMWAQSAMVVFDASATARALARATELALVLDEPARRWLLHVWQAMRTLNAGRFSEAEEQMIQAAEFGRATAQPDAQTLLAGQLFTARLLTNRLGEMVDLMGTELSAHDEKFPVWRAGYALALAEAGRTTAAADLIDESVSAQFADFPLDMVWLQAMAYLSMACVRLRYQNAAAAIFRRLLPWSGLSTNNGTVDAGPVDLHLGTLARLRGDTTTALRFLRAAEKQSRRVGSVVWQLRAQSERAIFSAGSGRPDASQNQHD